MIKKFSKGTYVLILQLTKGKRIRIGKLGNYEFKSGFYCYAGSTQGNGGLQQRLIHHSKFSKSPHWHIDYLRLHAEIKIIWINETNKKLEHIFADTLLEMNKVNSYIVGFGSSDCNCISHLFYFRAIPSLKEFRSKLDIKFPLRQISIREISNLI